MNNPRGGRRPGSGRPRTINNPIVANIRMPADSRQRITAIGHGNFSAGVRQLAEWFWLLDEVGKRHDMTAEEFVEALISNDIETTLLPD